jgi:thiosulfate reductase cytochrome b subunit
VQATATTPQIKAPRHTALVRVTHWLTFACFAALLLSGVEIIISHPRFYWGETGTVNEHPLFVIPIPASRDTVPTGYSYGLPDGNGWGRYLHFQSAWLLGIAGVLYLAVSLLNGHIRKDLMPLPGQCSVGAVFSRLRKYLRRAPADPAEESSYNVLQRWSYLGVIFILFPLLIWTGLAMSPSFTAAFPWTVELLGGKQSARTLHFFATIALVLFFAVHVTMVALSGFRSRMAAMITGRAPSTKEPGQ